MWYAVETIFVDGQLFESKCCFIDGDTSPVGHCFAGLDEEPHNSCQTIFDGRIEVHSDWFETEQLAHDFCNGKITYIHHYDAYYKASIRSTLTRFSRREIVKVDETNGIMPHRGIYKQHVLNYKPYWVR